MMPYGTGPDGWNDTPDAARHCEDWTTLDRPTLADVADINAPIADGRIHGWCLDGYHGRCDGIDDWTGTRYYCDCECHREGS